MIQIVTHKKSIIYKRVCDLEFCTKNEDVFFIFCKYDIWILSLAVFRAFIMKSISSMFVHLVFFFKITYYWRFIWNEFWFREICSKKSRFISMNGNQLIRSFILFNAQWFLLIKFSHFFISSPSLSIQRSFEIDFIPNYEHIRNLIREL